MMMMMMMIFFAPKIVATLLLPVSCWAWQTVISYL